MSAENRVDQGLSDALDAALSRAGAAALEASHELLDHYGDTGDASTQRGVDTLIVHAADALRALTDSFADISRVLREGTMESATTAAARPGVRAADRSRGARRPEDGRRV